MNREEADALARKLLATDGQHQAHILVDGGNVLAGTTPEARAFYEQYFLVGNEDKTMALEESPEDIAFYEARKQKKTTALKALRVTINTAIAEAKTVAEAEFMYGAGVDELSSAIHNLKQARMWAGEALGEIGHKLPVEYRDEAKQ
jgi:ribosomal protein L7/L12